MKMFDDVFNGIEALQINTNITLDKSETILSFHVS